jgi:hypothetical protein
MGKYKIAWSYVDDKLDDSKKRYELEEYDDLKEAKQELRRLNGAWPASAIKHWIEEDGDED